MLPANSTRLRSSLVFFLGLMLNIKHFNSTCTSTKTFSQSKSWGVYFVNFPDIFDVNRKNFFWGLRISYEIDNRNYRLQRGGGEAERKKWNLKFTLSFIFNSAQFRKIEWIIFLIKNEEIQQHQSRGQREESKKITTTKKRGGNVSLKVNNHK